MNRSGVLGQHTKRTLYRDAKALLRVWDESEDVNDLRGAVEQLRRAIEAEHMATGERAARAKARGLTAEQRAAKAAKLRAAADALQGFTPCAICGGAPAIHNGHPLNAAYPGHDYA